MPSIKPKNQPTAETADVLPMYVPKPKETRLLNALLEDHFDPERGAYANGWDDRKVAETINQDLGGKVTKTYVTEYRVEAYGDLTAHQEYEKLETEYTVLDDMMKDFRRRLDALSTTLGI